MTTALYLRVSTDRQTTENQLPDVLAACGRLGLGEPVRYQENASAASKRVVFQQMMEDARARKFGVLVIWALDRFGRSMLGNIRDVLELDRLGVRVVSVKEPWLDSNGPERRLLLAIFSWVAEQERLRLGDRVREGMKRAAASGTEMGRRSKKMLRGEEAEQVIRDWRESGMGYGDLAERLGCSKTWAHKIATKVEVESAENLLSGGRVVAQENAGGLAGVSASGCGVAMS